MLRTFTNTGHKTSLNVRNMLLVIADWFRGVGFFFFNFYSPWGCQQTILYMSGYLFPKQFESVA